MSKELNVVDTQITETAEISTQPEMIKLDDIALAMVGGGQAAVVF